MIGEQTYPNKVRRYGRLILTTVLQSGGAPVIDGCSTATVDGTHGVGVAIKPRPTVGRAFVIAWATGRPGPMPSRWRLVPKLLTRPRGHLV